MSASSSTESGKDSCDFEDGRELTDEDIDRCLVSLDFVIKPDPTSCGVVNVDFSKVLDNYPHLEGIRRTQSEPLNLLELGVTWPSINQSHYQVQSFETTATSLDVQIRYPARRVFYLDL